MKEAIELEKNHAPIGSIERYLEDMNVKGKSKLNFSADEIQKHIHKKFFKKYQKSPGDGTDIDLRTACMKILKITKKNKSQIIKKSYELILKYK